MRPRALLLGVLLPIAAAACDRSPSSAARGAGGSSPAAAAPAAAPARTGSAAGALSPEAAKGRSLYAVYCLRCHGPRGEGNGPMAAMLGNVGNLSDPTIDQRLPAEKMRELIKAGKNKMPAFGPVFSDEQLSQIVAFVQTLKR